MSEQEQVEEQLEGLGYTISRNDDSGDPKNYGQAPDLASACSLMAALYIRSGYAMRVKDEVGSSAAWIGTAG